MRHVARTVECVQRSDLVAAQCRPAITRIANAVVERHHRGLRRIRLRWIRYRRTVVAIVDDAIAVLVVHGGKAARRRVGPGARVVAARRADRETGDERDPPQHECQRSAYAGATTVTSTGDRQSASLVGADAHCATSVTGNDMFGVSAGQPDAYVAPDVGRGAVLVDWHSIEVV